MTSFHRVLVGLYCMVGNVTETVDVSHVTKELILHNLDQFRGEISQVRTIY